MGVNRTVSTWGGRMVVVSQPDNNSAVNTAHTNTQERELGMGMRP